MSERLIVDLFNRQQAWSAINEQLFPFLKANLQAEKKFVLEVREKTRSIAQNRRLWAMLTDISQQVDWYGQKLSPEDWKNVFSASLTKQRAVPGIDGGFVVLGKSTSKMTKPEMSELQDLIEAFGAQQGVRFTAPEYVDPETGEIT